MLKKEGNLHITIHNLVICTTIPQIFTLPYKIPHNDIISIRGCLTDRIVMIGAPYGLQIKLKEHKESDTTSLLLINHGTKRVDLI